MRRTGEGRRLPQASQQSGQLEEATKFDFETAG